MASARSTPAANAHSWVGRSYLSSPSNGPATTLRTSTPGATRAIGGSADAVARVKISTSMPRRARCSAVCST